MMSDVLDHVTQSLKETMTIAAPEPDQLYNFLAGVTIELFLQVAAEQGWHMRPDEATEEMIEAIMGGTEKFESDMLKFCRHWKHKDYHAMLAAAPKFEWRK